MCVCVREKEREKMTRRIREKKEGNREKSRRMNLLLKRNSVQVPKINVKNQKKEEQKYKRKKGKGGRKE